MIRIHKVATALMIGTLVFVGRTAVVEAAEDPIAGISIVLDGFYQNAQSTDVVAVKSLMNELSTEYDNMAFAHVSSYVNIRSKASEESEILGKLYNNSTATILDKADGWYKIKSGSVTGYIKAEYLVTGTDAEKLAKSIGTRLAVVNTTTLKVRKSASTDAEVITLVAMGDDLKVTKEQDGWVKVRLDDESYGYVSSDYVDLQTVYEEAVSIQEEQERILEEEASNNQASESSQGSTNNQTSNSSNDDSYIASTNNSSALGSEIVNFAVQFVGNPYVWGGTSLTNGADCSGFTQSVFAHFGISIPRTSRTQATGGKKVTVDNLQPGDLIFYDRNGTINHVGIYIGNGKVISASSPDTGIRITRYNYRTPYKIVRYL